MKTNANPYHSQSMYKGAPASSFIKAKTLRQNRTAAEIKLWEYLRSRRLLRYKFRQQHPIHCYIVDFYCHELKLIIEVDGEYHNEPSQIERDQERSFLLKFQDLHIIRFSNSEIIYAIDNVLDTITMYIKKIKDTPRPKGSQSSENH